MASGARWTAEQYADFMKRQRPLPAIEPAPEVAVIAFKRERRGMNKLESAYWYEVLQPMKQRAQILWCEFEPMRFRLADGAWFKPDFGVVTAAGALELHETKGYWREAARVRIRVAADRFPFRFIGIQRVRGEWVREEF